ncbi:hypothetical protein ECEC1868_1766, partial [Escherichia coli EC1868]
TIKKAMPVKNRQKVMPRKKRLTVLRCHHLPGWW